MEENTRIPPAAAGQTSAGRTSSIVYVREASEQMLPDDLKGAERRFYSLHDEAGNVLALAPKREIAFALAKRNDLSPVSVH